MAKRNRKNKKIKKDYQAKNLDNPFFRKKSKKKKKPSFLWIKLVLAFLVVAGLSWLLFIFPYWNIEEIEILNYERINPERVKARIIEQKNKKSFFIFSQENIFLFKKSALIEDLKEEFNLSDIKIKKKLPNTLKVDVIEKPYSYIYAEKDEYFFASSDNYIMSNIEFSDSDNIQAQNMAQEPMMAKMMMTGEAVEGSDENASTEKENKTGNLVEDSDDKESDAKQPDDALNSESSNNDNLNTDQGVVDSLKENTDNQEGSIDLNLNDDTNKEDETKDTLDIAIVGPEEKENYLIIENKNKKTLIKNEDKVSLKSDYLSFIFDLNKELKKYEDLAVDRFIIIDQYFNSVFVKLKEGPQLYFNVNLDINEQISNLFLIRNNKIQDKFKLLEYIDLRYGKKVFCYPENIID